MVEVSLTVGKLDASLALLLTKEHHLIEFPTVLLPDGVAAGSVVTIRCEQNHDLEEQEARQFEAVQDEILQLFGTHEPKTPNLRVRNVTQTSAVLEWDPLDLGSASIKSLTLYKNGQRLGQVPNPLSSTTSKLSGLPVDTPYEFHLRLDTTAGVYVSEKVKLHTHKMTDLSGITVCLGDIDPSEGITLEDIETSLKNIGGRPLQTEVAVDTTHLVATVGLGAQWKKAVDSNIPVVRPEWLKACEEERRIVGVRNFYLDADPKFLAQHKFNKTVKTEVGSKEAEPVSEEEPVKGLSEEKENEQPVNEEGATTETAQESSAPVNEATAEPTVVENPAQEATLEEAPLDEISLQESPVPTEEVAIENPVTEELSVETTAEPIEESTVAEEETKEDPISEEKTPVEEEAPVEDKSPADEIQASAELTDVEETIPEPVQEPTPAEESVEEPSAQDNFDDVDIDATEEKPAIENDAPEAITETITETTPGATPELEGAEEEEEAEDGEDGDGTVPTPADAQPDGKTQGNAGKSKNKKKKKKGKK